MRDYILFYVNGHRYEVSGADAFLSLADFLRRKLGLIGTKIVCSEGDCGACTVLVGRPKASSGQPDSPLAYASIDACIQFVFQLDGTQVITIEGLNRMPGQRECGASPGAVEYADIGHLHGVQQALVDCHSSQCGFCTPGFVMAMVGLHETREALDESRLRRGLTGNLCRCTGYTQILEAGLQASVPQPIAGRLDTPHLRADLARHASMQVEIEAPGSAQTQRLASPTRLAEALAFLRTHPEATIVAGATDLGVRANKSGRLPTPLLDLNRIEELAEVRIQSPQGAVSQLIAGARASWSAIERVGAGRLPELQRILSVFGSPQIRHAGTIGGNIANASPIADSLPFLYVTEAMLELSRTDERGMIHQREVNINDFYLGYKSLDLQPGELITQVRVPLPEEDEALRLYKVSRRRDLDIASFTAAIRMRIDRGTIATCALALGAVGPTVVRPRQTEAFLRGKRLTVETMRAAGEVAVGEITPISDVRGSAAYRKQLTRNIVLKFFHELVPILLLLILLGAGPARARDSSQYAAARARLVHDVVETSGITDPRVIQSVLDTPRHEFVPRPLRSQAYFDMALPIGYQQTISSPFIVAFMTESLDLQPTDKVLEIGTGSGYQAAILSPLVQAVYSIEIIEPLGKRAAQTLHRLGYENVHTKIGDGYQGWPEHAPFDKIIVTCSPEKIPQPLVRQLREGGVIVIPVGERYQQVLVRLRKHRGKLAKEKLRTTLFVPMTGRAEQARQIQPDPAHPEVRNGDFERPLPENEFVTGWYYQRQLKLVTDPSAPSGKNFITFKNTDLGRSAHLLQGIPIDGTRVRQFRLSAWIKTRDIHPGPKLYDVPMIAVSFYDEKRNVLGYRTLGPYLGNNPWREVRQQVTVPRAARELILRIGLFGATGEASFDNLRIEKLDRSKNGR